MDFLVWFVHPGVTLKFIWPWDTRRTLKERRLEAALVQSQDSLKADTVCLFVYLMDPH